MSVRMLIVDDHEFFRRSLRRVLDELPGCEVIGEAADGVEAILLAESLHPEIVLMDIHMPRMEGNVAGALLKERLPATKVWLYSLDHSALQASRPTVDAVVKKQDLFSELPGLLGQVSTSGVSAMTS